MQQIIQSYKTGEMKLEEVSVPQVVAGAVLVETVASLVSAGTEKMLVDLARKSLVGKARTRPDLVKKVIEKAKREGIASTLQKVRSKLDNPIPLGYSCAGIVREVGDGVDEFQVGDWVACGGAGTPTTRILTWCRGTFACGCRSGTGSPCRRRRRPLPLWARLRCRGSGRPG